MASLHEQWRTYQKTHNIPNDTAAWKILTSYNKLIRKTSYGNWCRSPNKGVGVTIKGYIETAIAEVIAGKPPAYSDCALDHSSQGSSTKSVTPDPIDADGDSDTPGRVDTMCADESPVALTMVPMPADGWANDEWRGYLFSVARGTKLHTQMARLHADKRDLPRVKRRTEGYVYIARDPAKPGVKVGVAVDPNARKSAFSTMCPNMDMLACIHSVDAYAVENLVHKLGRQAQKEDLYPGRKHEWLYLTGSEAIVCVTVAVMVVEDTLLARVGREPSRDRET
jgi:hypothetical protein